MCSKDTTIRNSETLYLAMTKTCQYTFNELQGKSNLNDTELCLAIGQLMQEGRLIQMKNTDGIYYSVA